MRSFSLVILFLATSLHYASSSPQVAQSKSFEASASLEANFDVNITQSGQISQMNGLGFGACKDLKGASNAGIDIKGSLQNVDGANTTSAANATITGNTTSTADASASAGSNTNQTAQVTTAGSAITTSDTMTQVDTLPGFLATVNLKVGGQTVCTGSKDAVVTAKGYQCNCVKKGHSLYLVKNNYFRLKKKASFTGFCKNQYVFIYNDSVKSHRIVLEAPKQSWKKSKKYCKVKYAKAFKCHK